MMRSERDVRAELAGRPALLQEAARRGLAYLDGLADRPVAPSPDAVAALGKLDFALPREGLDPGIVLSLLDKVGSLVEVLLSAKLWPKDEKLKLGSSS